jgi:uncharacterized Zn-finger protein
MLKFTRQPQWWEQDGEEAQQEPPSTSRQPIIITPAPQIGGGTSSSSTITLESPELLLITSEDEDHPDSDDPPGPTTTTTRHFIVDYSDSEDFDAETLAVISKQLNDRTPITVAEQPTPSPDLKTPLDTRCDVCGRIFSQQCNMKRHKRQFHTVDKDARRQHQCKDCGKRYMKACTMYRHMRTYHSLTDGCIGSRGLKLT